MRPSKDLGIAVLFFVVIAGLLTASLVPLGRRPAPIGVQDDLDDNAVALRRSWANAVAQNQRLQVQTWIPSPPQWNPNGVVFTGLPQLPAP